jgi:hypothetical protein
MSNNFSAEEIATLVIILFMAGLWVIGLIESAKAKAFNEGYKRGRSSLNVREIVK